ncbi:MAG TPA: helix-turn-helix transcriptional regulator [Planctomycetaceae bacterium]|jgi:predicted transcriptional regulator
MSKQRARAKSDLTAEQRAALKDKRDKFQRERPTLAQLQASGEYSEPVTQREYWSCRKVGLLLKQLREQQGLSLADLSSRTGMDRAALSRLENSGNPTLKTLFRYAEGIGMEIVFEGAPGKTVAIRIQERRTKSTVPHAS